MIPVNLMDALAERLQVILKDYSSGNPQDEVTGSVILGRNPLKIHTGQIPVPEDASELESFVYVIVKKIEDKGGQDLSSATVEIGVSIYDEDETGWRNLYNIVEHIRQDLLKHRILNKKFMLQWPINTEFAEEQPYPQWVGAITAKYSIGQPVEEGIAYDNYQEIGFQRN